MVRNLTYVYLAFKYIFYFSIFIKINVVLSCSKTRLSKLLPQSFARYKCIIIIIIKYVGLYMLSRSDPGFSHKNLLHL